MFGGKLLAVDVHIFSGPEPLFKRQGWWKRQKRARASASTCGRAAASTPLPKAKKSQQLQRLQPLSSLRFSLLKHVGVETKSIRSHEFLIPSICLKAIHCHSWILRLEVPNLTVEVEDSPSALSPACCQCRMTKN